MREKLLIMNYCVVDYYGTEGGANHLHANLEGLKERYSWILLIGSLNRKLFFRSGNVLVFSIHPTVGKKTREIAPSNYGFNTKKCLVFFLKPLYLFAFRSIINIMTLILDIDYYERANKSLFFRSSFFKQKIIEINDEYVPKDLNYFTHLLAVSNRRDFEEFKGKKYFGIWPTKTRMVNKSRQKEEGLILFVKSSYFQPNMEWIVKIVYECFQEFEEPNLLFIGFDESTLNMTLKKRFQATPFMCDADFKDLLAKSVLVVAPYGNLNAERAKMGAPMKIIDALLARNRVITDALFPSLNDLMSSSLILNEVINNAWTDEDDTLVMDLIVRNVDPMSYFKNLFL